MDFMALGSGDAAVSPNSSRQERVAKSPRQTTAQFRDVESTGDLVIGNRFPKLDVGSHGTQLGLQKSQRCGMVGRAPGFWEPCPVSMTLRLLIPPL